MNGKDIKIMVGSALRELRKARGYTQEQLAELIGKQANAINRIETGINFLKSDTFANICNVLKIHPSLLLSEKPQLFLNEDVHYIKEINRLLQTFPPDKLRSAYNILLALKK